MMTRLKSGTEACHRKLEGRFPISAPDFDRTCYVRLLKSFYGFHRPLEAAIAAAMSPTQREDFELPRRLRASKLARDLAFLGVPPEEVTALPDCEDLPAVLTPAQAIGALYVLEGSTLGGQFILKRLTAQLDVDAERGAAYYAGHGGDTGPLWKRFGERVNALPLSETERTDAVQAAVGTFEGLERWMTRTGVFV
jgi:heme oxygenase